MSSYRTGLRNLARGRGRRGGAAIGAAESHQDFVAQGGPAPGTPWREPPSSSGCSEPALPALIGFVVGGALVWALKQGCP